MSNVPAGHPAPSGTGAAGAAAPTPARPRRDPGLQPERTALAWRRTALALAVNGLLVGRSAILESSALLAAIAVAVLASAAGLLAVAWHRRITLLSTHVHQSAPHATTMALTVAAVMLLCLGALLLV